MLDSVLSERSRENFCFVSQKCRGCEQKPVFFCITQQQQQQQKHEQWCLIKQCVFTYFIN